MDCAAVSVSVGTVPLGDVDAANSLLQASGVTRVTQPASTSASVAKFAIVGVWPLLSGSWMVAPQPPVARSTKLGTLPAAIFSPSAWPLSAGPSRNCAFVQTDATVVISLIVTVGGALPPNTDSKAMAGLSPPDLSAADLPPWATRYNVVSLPAAFGASSTKRPSAPVLICASCLGAPALAPKSVTVEFAIGAPPPSTCPLIGRCGHRRIRQRASHDKRADPCATTPNAFAPKRGHIHSGLLRFNVATIFRPPAIQHSSLVHDGETGTRAGCGRTLRAQTGLNTDLWFSPHRRSRRRMCAP